MAEQGERHARRARVSQAIRDHLSEMIGRDVRDPRVSKVGLITVNLVELNRDMSTARVYVSFLGSDERAIRDAMLGLEASARYLRGPVARRMNLARAPQLRFVHDKSPEFKHRLAEIIAEDEERAREAEPPDDAPQDDDAAPTNEAEPADDAAQGDDS